ncbi:MAG: hypothetical protein ABI233_11130 [Chthoniobacterales bacterium]
MTTPEHSLFVPVIIGTGRRGRRTEPVANFVFAELLMREDVESELIEEAYIRSVDAFFDELFWRARALRTAREQIPA